MHFARSFVIDPSGVSYWIIIAPIRTERPSLSDRNRQIASQQHLRNLDEYIPRPAEGRIPKPDRIDLRATGMARHRFCRESRSRPRGSFRAAMKSIQSRQTEWQPYHLRLLTLDKRQIKWNFAPNSSESGVIVCSERKLCDPVPLFSFCFWLTGPDANRNCGVSMPGRFSLSPEQEQHLLDSFAALAGQGGIARSQCYCPSLRAAGRTHDRFQHDLPLARSAGSGANSESFLVLSCRKEGKCLSKWLCRTGKKVAFCFEITICTRAKVSTGSTRT